MELFPFQINASTEIATKYAEYVADPLMIKRDLLVPFYQNLNAITGSGKTLILADAISQIRGHLAVEPIILWLSRGKVVVWQTYTNLSSGKYHDLIKGYVVKPLLDCKPIDIEHATTGLILVATVGKFNQKDKEEGSRKVFQLEWDRADKSLWDMLRERRDSQGRRRPFLVVYDEGHNLSNQQTELLRELNPDALILASATMKVPEALSNTVSRFRNDKKWGDSDFCTVVKSSDVVESGLVKQQILLGGYMTPMEIAINDLLEQMRNVEVAASELELQFKPKAIYVSNTNVVPGSGNVDHLHAPFSERQARPILIWRHLVENQGVDPDTVAVYCNLKFDSKFPPPSTFNLFAGGDSDYENFMAGKYQHIIFNLTLQEGWDDPTCYFAYIDKDMGARDQITQVIGRVLRQPGAKHYPVPSLNTAHFFIRTDAKRLFEEVLSDVRSKIAADLPEINITIFKGGKGSVSKQSQEPKKKRKLPEVSIHAQNAMNPIRGIMASMPDYRQDIVNTIGKGGRIQILQRIGTNENEWDEWVELDHSNRVTARWVFVREIQKSYSKAGNLCDIEDARLDAMVEYNSTAAIQISEIARKIVNAYLEHSTIAQDSANAIWVPSVLVDPESAKRFAHALHESYSDLNGFELEFAQALDKKQHVWFRNPSRGCFEIPLLTRGRTRKFSPDFVVWANKQVIAIDTKGDHLIVEDAGRKLFHIEKRGRSPNLSIRLVTRGTWNDRIEKENREGYTVWALKGGKPHPSHANDIGQAVDLCLRTD